MEEKKKIVIIGAGPGSLAAGMILAARGFNVSVFEKSGHVGGRNAALKVGDFSFDTGPTFVMLPQVFEEVFSLAGKKLGDYLDFQQLDPLYRLRFGDGRDFFIYFDKEKMKQEITRVFPGEENGYENFLKKHLKKFELTYACLKVPYNKIYHYLRWKFLKALPAMQLHKSVYGVLSDYFKSENFRMSMTFQAKYLGMSPWKCPGAFSILSYMEHKFGIYHIKGGVFQLSVQMAEIIKDLGGKIILNSQVKEVIIEGKKASGIILESGEEILADAVIMGADFAAGIKSLVPEKSRPSYSDKKLSKMRYSCSTLMFYFGMKKKYDIPHHNIFFGHDYKKNVEEIFSRAGLPSDPAFYIQNASATDDSLAPVGKSTIYVLVPVSNLRFDYPWEEKKKELRDFIVNEITKRTEMKDFAENIEAEKMIVPPDWQSEYNVYDGAVFNLSHDLLQMLFLRPHNEFNDIKGLYLTGGGTHPGSGLPTILESGRIAAEMISGKKI
jgi:phytoene desaturase